MVQSTASPQDVARIYAALYLVRRAEEEVARIYPSDKIKSPVHLSIGQEAVAVGVCDALAQTYAWYLRCECEKELTHA